MNNIVLRISWSRIMDEFFNKYDEVYSNKSVSAYLDFTNTVIEGPKVCFNIFLYKYFYKSN